MSDSDQMWEKHTMRLKSIAYRECRGHGISVISVSLLIDDNGELRSWTDPSVKHIEPKDNHTCSSLIEMLAPHE